MVCDECGGPLTLPRGSVCNLCWARLMEKEFGPEAGDRVREVDRLAALPPRSLSTREPELLVLKQENPGKRRQKKKQQEAPGQLSLWDLE